MARVALGGSFRTLRTYGTDSVGSYLRSLRLEKEAVEDSYWNAALQNGDETPEAVLEYWEGQRSRFPVGSIDYKTYTTRLKNIQETIDTSKVNELIASKNFDEAINHYQTKILSKYEKDSPAWSDAFVKLQQIKEAKISYDVSLQEAKLRAQHSVGGLSGKNLVSYYADLLKYLTDNGLTDRQEYFQAVEGQNTAIAQAAEQEKQKESAQFNQRLNELIGEREGVITSQDWVDIYSQLAGEFPQGSESYAKALEQLTKATDKQKTDAENQRKEQSQIIMNTVLSKYASGGITDEEYAQAMQEMLPMLPPGSEEANEIARQLGNLQESLGKKGTANDLQQLQQQIMQLEQQAQQQQLQFQSGLMNGEEYDQSRQQFLQAVAPLYEKYVQNSNDQGAYQNLLTYQQEAQAMPERLAQRQAGELVDRVMTDSKGNRTVETVNMRTLDLTGVEDDYGNPYIDIITDKGIERFANVPLAEGSDTFVWQDNAGNQFLHLPSTQGAKQNFTIPTDLAPEQKQSVVNQIKQLEQNSPSNANVNYSLMFSQASQPKVTQGSGSTFKMPDFSGVGQSVLNNISSNPLASPGPSIAGFDLSNFKMPEIPKIASNVGNWLTSNVWNPGAGTAKVESAVKNIGSTISNTAKDLWQGFKQKTSSISPWW